MRAIPRAQLQAVIDRFTHTDFDCHDDELNVSIFRLFDDRELRRQPRLMEQFLEDARPPDPTRMYDALQSMQPCSYERWAIVDPFVYVDNDYRDEAPPEAFQQLLGYNDADGNFVPTPSLSALPRYVSSLADACSLKNLAFGPYLFLRWTEVPGEWGFDYEAALLTKTGETVSKFSADQGSLAIVGAVLLAMASGWTHHLAKFRVVE